MKSHWCYPIPSPSSAHQDLLSFKTKSRWYKEIRQNWIRNMTLLIPDCATFIITEHQFLHQNKNTAHPSELF